MPQSLRRSIILALVGILLAMGAGELLLRWIDPTGMYLYGASQHRLWSDMRPDPLGYTFEPGIHDFYAYTVTIDDRGNRIMPERPEAVCSIMFTGDSVTFGLGVNDEDTFAYLIAERVPDVQFANAAKSGFNARNLQWVSETYQPDGFVYLAIGNDAEYPAVVTQSGRPRLDPLRATRLYVSRLRPYAPPLDPEWQDIMRAWLDASNTLIVMFDEEGDVYDWLRSSYPTVTIPGYQHYISKADAHPSPEGHREIADALTPYVDTFVQSTCAK